MVKYTKNYVSMINIRALPDKREISNGFLIALIIYCETHFKVESMMC